MWGGGIIQYRQQCYVHTIPGGLRDGDKGLEKNFQNLNICFFWKVFNGNHYPGKGGIQPPRASPTDLMVMEV